MTPSTGPAARTTPAVPRSPTRTAPAATRPRASSSPTPRGRPIPPATSPGPIPMVPPSRPIPTNLPTGAHRVTWDLKSFTVNASSHPVFVFRFLEDGVRKDFNTYAAGATGFWDNYVGGPSFYVAMGTPQDGITAPADWNTTASVNFFRSLERLRWHHGDPHRPRCQRLLHPDHDRHDRSDGRHHGHGRHRLHLRLRLHRHAADPDRRSGLSRTIPPPSWAA